MDFLKENKVLAGIIGAILAATLLYFAFFSGSGSSTLLVSTAQVGNSQVSKELLSTLGDLKSIKLDNTIFNDAAYMSLVDFHVDIPLQPIGRGNPFEELPSSINGGTAGTVSLPVGKGL